MARTSKKLEKTCQFCFKKYFIFPAWDRKTENGSSFCSRKCQALGQRRGVTRPCKVCGGDFTVPMCYTKRYKTCEKPSCRLENKKGKNNPNYRHGKSPGDRSDKRYEGWRLSVFKRDDHTCQMCGKRGGPLHADHIKPWAYFKDLRYRISNGRTLCVPCHYTTYKDVFKHRPRKEKA